MSDSPRRPSRHDLDFLALVLSVYEQQVRMLAELQGVLAARQFRRFAPFSVFTARLWAEFQGTGPMSRSIRAAYERIAQSYDAPDLEEVRRVLILDPETSIPLVLSTGERVMRPLGRIPAELFTAEFLENLRVAGHEETVIMSGAGEWQEVALTLLRFLRGWAQASMEVAGLSPTMIQGNLREYLPMPPMPQVAETV